MNKGTSRGNAGSIKIQSLSRLWETRPNGKPHVVSTPRGLQRAGSVPTAIAQALEGPKVEEKIVTLLDFVAVIVRDEDMQSGTETSSPGYLLYELAGLDDGVRFLEDGVEDVLEDVDKGFDLLEREFRSMTGKSWSSVESTRLSEIKIKHCDRFIDQQRLFLIKSHRFLMQAGGARNFLKQEENVVEQYLKSAVQWLAEGNSDNPKLTLKQLLEFSRRFDESFHKLKSCVTPIAE